MFSLWRRCSHETRLGGFPQWHIETVQYSTAKTFHCVERPAKDHVIKVSLATFKHSLSGLAVLMPIRLIRTTTGVCETVRGAIRDQYKRLTLYLNFHAWDPTQIIIQDLATKSIHSRRVVYAIHEVLGSEWIAVTAQLPGRVNISVCLDDRGCLCLL